MKKHRISRILSLLLMLAVFCTFVLPDFCESGQAYAASSMHLSKSKISLNVGSSKKVSLVLPNGKTVPSSKVVWKTSSSKIAKVRKGTITAVKRGTCTITAKYKGKSYKCKVTVKGIIHIEPSSTILYELQSTKLILYDAKDKAIDNASVTWSVSDSAIAEINYNGELTALKAGTVKVTATYDGKTYSCSIKISAPQAILSSSTIKEGATTKFTLWNGNTKVDTSLISFSSDSKTVASVSPDGTVTGLTGGTAAITAKYNGKEYKRNLTVRGSITYSGNGEDVIKVNIPRGLYKVTSTHSGKSNFIVHGLDSSGDTVEYMANFIGNGCSSAYITDALSYIEIEIADGPWTIKISEIDDGGTTKIKGRGDSISPFFYLSKKVYTVTSSAYSGDSNFIVHVIGSDGEIEGFIANEIGVKTVRHTFTPPRAGYYFLDVEADQDADWMVDFGEGAAVTTVDNHIKNVGSQTPLKPETPSNPTGPSSGTGGIYAGNAPEDNLTLLAANVASKGKYTISASSSDEASITYSVTNRELTFSYMLETSGLKTWSTVVYHTDSKTWGKMHFSMVGTTPSTFCSGDGETKVSFDPSSYYYGKDLDYAIWGTTIGLDGMTDADMSEIASTGAKTMWAAMDALLYTKDQMRLNDIGFNL
ncbi:MAG: Ig-like domain-containing protein [Dorea sp.]|nr:Ig-like domain-containing protein [Dorea sp.]